MFKKGDRVRVIKESGDFPDKLPLGFETTVISDDLPGWVSIIDASGRESIWFSYRFEKIGEEMFEPKSGMVVKIKATDKYYWGLLIQVGDKLVRLSDYHENGSYDAFCSSDVMEHVVEVYEGMLKLPNVALNHNLGVKHQLGKLLWKKEPPIVELSIDEIAKKFGLCPKQIRIKKENETS